MTAIASLRFATARGIETRREGFSELPLRAPVTVEPSNAAVVGAQPTLSALKSCPWFSAWPQPVLASLASVASLRSFGPGQVIVPEGETAGTIAVVVKGRVRVIQRAEGGREVTLEVFRAGQLCTEALFGDSVAAFSNDWIAAETSLLLFLPRAEFLAALRGMPEAAFALARDFERRLGRAKQLAAGLALADAQARLFQILGRLAREEGEPCPEGMLVRRCPTQQELGNMIGACRETVSRMIADLARKELLSFQGRKMRLSTRFLDEIAPRAEA